MTKPIRPLDISYRDCDSKHVVVHGKKITLAAALKRSGLTDAARAKLTARSTKKTQVVSTVDWTKAKAEAAERRSKGRFQVPLNAYADDPRA